AMIKKIVYHEKNMPISIIMNRSREKKQGKMVMDQFQAIIRNFLHVETRALGILPDDPIVSDAVSHQKPFILWKGKSPVSKELKKIADDYMGAADGVDRKQSASFVQKLKRLLMEREK